MEWGGIGAGFVIRHSSLLIRHSSFVIRHFLVRAVSTRLRESESVPIYGRNGCAAAVLLRGGALLGFWLHSLKINTEHVHTGDFPVGSKREDRLFVFEPIFLCDKGVEMVMLEP